MSPIEQREEKRDFARLIVEKKGIEEKAFLVPGPSSLMVKSSSKNNPMTNYQRERNANKDPDQSVDILPRHLQKLVDEFCSKNNLSARNGPCTQGLKSLRVEENVLGKSIAFVYGRTGEHLAAKKCLIRNNNFALVVDGPGLSQVSIIRCYPRATGIGGISAWMVWKGLEGVERGFLIFKLVESSFASPDGKRRKELFDLQSSFKRTKKDPFVRVKSKPSTQSTKPVTGISISGKRKDLDTSGIFQQSALSEAPSMGQLSDPSEKPKKSVPLGGEMVDLTEEAHTLTKANSNVKKEKVLDANVPRPYPRQTMTLKDSMASSSQADTATKPPAEPPCLPLHLPDHIRESTLLSFISSLNQVSRMRKFATCDTAGKLFLQADAGGLVRRSDEEAALSLTIPGASRLLIIPNKDEASFEEFVDAIADVQRRSEGQKSAPCVVEVRRYW